MSRTTSLPEPDPPVPQVGVQPFTAPANEPRAGPAVKATEAGGSPRLRNRRKRLRPAACGARDRRLGADWYEHLFHHIPPVVERPAILPPSSGMAIRSERERRSGPLDRSNRGDVHILLRTRHTAGENAV
jgi:hypothetical protein